MLWRAARCLRLCARLLSPLSVMFAQLRTGWNETSHSCHYSYRLKSRLMLWRAARCLRICARLSSPLSVMLPHLRIRRYKITNSCHDIYPLKHSWRSLVGINSFRLFLISFISFPVIISLWFMLSDFNLFSFYLSPVESWTFFAAYFITLIVISNSKVENRQFLF